MKTLLVLILAFLSFSPARASAPVITLTSPAAFQVFQRVTTTNTGSLVISGSVSNWTGGDYTVSASWRGLDSGVLYTGVGSTFAAVWSGLGIGQGDLLVTVAGVEISVPVVSVGDVYIVAGQSNAVGFGQNYQTYMDTMGLRASMFTLWGWSELQDPTGKTGLPAAGSEWPLLASYILDSGVPVAFVPTAYTASIIETWQPGQTHYQALITRMDKLPAPYARAVLWQQGESNSHAPAKSYSVYLSTLADLLDARYGVPLLAAHLYNNTLVDAGIDEAIRGDAHVLAGADLRAALPPSAGVHYHTDEELQSEAWQWWLALVAAGYYSGVPAMG